MKKIGFIDYYIDEWHAHNYPQMIRQSRFAGRFDVTLAWEQQVKPGGGMDIATWSRNQNVPVARSIEEVVAASDCIVVLSPDNPEQHETLADLPLKSGKPVYIDKPIAPSLDAAKRLFEKAAKHHTPMMSCSALRFGSALETAISDTIAGRKVQWVGTRGGGKFGVYAIHQFEMLVMALGTGATRVMHCGTAATPHLVIEYPDGRRGSVTLMLGHPFELSAQFGDDASVSVTKMDDFFPRFIDGMLTFFDTGKSLVPQAQTLEIAALIEAGNMAITRPDTWVNVPR
jgi:predicted dehydrogenase